ncbi:N-recognin zinc finger protein, partial (macronuclear) [Tetrahymena thermophila SB210]
FISILGNLFKIKFKHKKKMKNQYKIGLLSIGGAAIAAGVYLYFFRRNLSVQQRYYKMLHSFKYDVFSCDQFQLSNMNLRFDQMLNFATHDEKDPDMIFSEKLQYKDIESLKQSGACGKGFGNGAIYYECLDCSPIRQELKNTHKVAEKDQIYLVLCEDCFFMKHKNHQFVKYDSGVSCDFKCHCGQSSFMDKEHFCSDHQGYEKLKDIFEEEQKQNQGLWNGVEKFFLDVFHLLFESMCELHLRKSQKKIKQEQLTTQTERINLIVELIFKKINEIIELNPPSIHFMPSILLKHLAKPIGLELVKEKQHDSTDYKWVRKINKDKKINNELSILDYIFLLYEFIDNQNDQLINDTFRALIKVDEIFSQRFCEIFIKTFRYSLREQNANVENYGIVNEGYLPSCSFILVEFICLNNVFNHLIDSLGVGIFEPLNFLIEWVEKKQRSIAELDYVQYILLNIAFEMFRFVNQLKVLLQKYPNELISKLHLLSFVLFKVNSFETTSENPEEYIPLFVCTLLQFRQLEKHVLYCYINICEGLLLINDEKLTNNIFPILIQEFKQTVIKARQFLDQKTQENKQFCTSSITLISHLPLLVALSERKLFSKEVISSFFKKHFEFDNESSKQKFFQSLHMISRSFQTFNQDINLYQLIFLYHQFIQNQQQANFYKELSRANEDFLFSCKYRIYDFLNLTYSIILLEDEQDYKKNGKHILSQYVQGYLSQLRQQMQGQEINPIKQLNLNSNSTILFQQIADSIPFFNVFANSYQLYFPELVASEKNEGKALIQKNIEEFIITNINLQKDSKMYIKDVLQLCSEQIYQTNIVEKYIQGVCQKTKNQDESQEIILLDEFKQKFYTRHILRYNSFDILEKLIAVTSKFSDSKEEYTCLGSDFNLKNLFPYQRDLCKKIFLDESYVEKLVKLNCIQNIKIIYMKSIIYQIFIVFKVIKSKDQVELFTEQEQSQIQKITEILKTKQLLDFYSSVNSKFEGREKLLFSELILINNLIHTYLQELHSN